MHLPYVGYAVTISRVCLFIYSWSLPCPFYAARIFINWMSERERERERENGNWKLSLRKVWGTFFMWRNKMLSLLSCIHVFYLITYRLKYAVCSSVWVWNVTRIKDVTCIRCRAELAHSVYLLGYGLPDQEIGVCFYGSDHSVASSAEIKYAFTR
jgi:hypothetical protein